MKSKTLKQRIEAAFDEIEKEFPSKKQGKKFRDAKNENYYYTGFPQ